MGLWGSVFCNGVTQCWPVQREQAIVPGSSPYMVRGKWIQAHALPTKHDQIPSPNKINYPNVLFLGSSLFIYSSVHQLLLVAHCQLSSSTMGVLLTLHLSRQHITAYLY